MRNLQIVWEKKEDKNSPAFKKPINFLCMCEKSKIVFLVWQETKSDDKKQEAGIIFTCKGLPIYAKYGGVWLETDYNLFERNMQKKLHYFCLKI